VLAGLSRAHFVYHVILYAQSSPSASQDPPSPRRSFSQMYLLELALVHVSLVIVFVLLLLFVMLGTRRLTVTCWRATNVIIKTFSQSVVLFVHLAPSCGQWRFFGDYSGSM